MDSEGKEGKGEGGREGGKRGRGREVCSNRSNKTEQNVLQTYK